MTAAYGDPDISLEWKIDFDCNPFSRIRVPLSVWRNLNDSDRKNWTFEAQEMEAKRQRYRSSGFAKELEAACERISARPDAGVELRQACHSLQVALRSGAGYYSADDPPAPTTAAAPSATTATICDHLRQACQHLQAALRSSAGCYSADDPPAPTTASAPSATTAALSAALAASPASSTTRC